MAVLPLPISQTPALGRAVAVRPVVPPSASRNWSPPHSRPSTWTKKAAGITSSRPGSCRNWSCLSARASWRGRTTGPSGRADPGRGGIVQGTNHRRLRGLAGGEFRAGGEPTPRRHRRQRPGMCHLARQAEKRYLVGRATGRRVVRVDPRDKTRYSASREPWSCAVYSGAPTPAPPSPEQPRLAVEGNRTFSCPVRAAVALSLLESW